MMDDLPNQLKLASDYNASSLFFSSAKQAKREKTENSEEPIMKLG